MLHNSTYGIVYKAQNKVTGTCVAIKKFKDSDDDEYVREASSFFSVKSQLSFFLYPGTQDSIT